MTDPLAGPGDRIGRYVIESGLGSGGMGQVYRAYDEVLHRRVALKLLHTASLTRESGEAAAQAVERIRREARMAAALDHPNVVAIHDVGEHEGVAFIVMEHVLGKSLRTFVTTDVPIETRVAWLLDVARALAAAHKAGLVHRDVKPENVMVRNDGAVKVLDFGIARRATDARISAPPANPSPLSDAARDLPETLRATLAGTRDDAGLVGTPGYMPPELMIHGNSDARSDQFAWGVMAYEVLVGSLPWTRGDDPAALCAAALFDPAPPLGSRCPTVAPALAAAVDRALAKDPAQRFESMEVLLRSVGADPSPHASLLPPPEVATPHEIALAPTAASGPVLGSGRAPSAISGGSIGTAPPAVTERRAQSPVTPRARRGIGAFGLVVLAVLGVRALRSGRGHETRRGDPPGSPGTFELRNVHRITFDQGCEEFPSFSPDGETVFFDAQDGDDYHVFSMRIADGERRRITSDAGWQYASSLSPDGTMVAYVARANEDVGVWVARVDGSTPPHAIAAGPVRPTWSRDGRSVWAGPGATASRYDVATGAALESVHAEPAHVISMILPLPDGRLAMREATDDNRGTAILVLYDGRRHRSTRTSQDISFDEAMTLAPGGRAIFLAREVVDLRNQVWRVDLGTGDPTAMGEAESTPTKGMQISTRGDRFVWSDCGEHTVTVGLRHEGTDTNLRPHELLPRRDWRDWNVTAVATTSLIVTASDRAGQPQPWIVDTSSHLPPRMIAVDGRVGGLAVTSDQRLLAFALNGAGIFVAPFDGSGRPRALTHEASDEMPAFAPDNARMYFQRDFDRQRRVAVVPVGGGEPEWALPTGTGNPSVCASRHLLGYIARGADGTSGVPRIRSLDTGEDRLLSPSLSPGTYAPIAFSPDGSRAAVTDSARRVLEVDVATGAIVGRFDTGGDQVRGLTFTRDGIVISQSQWSGDLWIADGRFR